jgi:hypothetical protein
MSDCPAYGQYVTEEGDLIRYRNDPIPEMSDAGMPMPAAQPSCRCPAMSNIPIQKSLDINVILYVIIRLCLLSFQKKFCVQEILYCTI